MRSVPVEMSFIMNMWTVNAVVSKKLDGSLGAVHGIGFTEYMVLFHLNNGHNKALRRIDLANKVGLTASGITRIVSPMEKIGLVAKELNPRDARVSLVKLTPAGEVILGDATLSFEQTCKRMTSGTGEENLTHALEALKAVGGDVYVDS